MLANLGKISPVALTAVEMAIKIMLSGALLEQGLIAELMSK